MTWQQTLKEGHEIVLATCSNNIPRAIVVISLGFIEGKLLIGACQMKSTLENIRKNSRVSIVAKYNGEYYRINGIAEIHSSGKYFDAATERSKPPLPKHAIAVGIEEVFDLDKGEILNK